MQTEMKQDDQTKGALAVANYFIDIAKREGRELTPQRLMALVYITHGFSLAVFGDGVLNPQYDRVEAWPAYYSGYYPKARERERQAKEVRSLTERVWRKFWKPRG